MQLTAFCKILPVRGTVMLSTRKFIRVMKLTTVLLLAGCLQISARGLSQKVTLSERNISLMRLFNEISRQTGVSIMYDEASIQDLGPVTIRVKDASPKEVLERCLGNKPLNFYIEGNTILIKRKPDLSPASATPLAAAVLPPDIHGRVVDEKGEPVPGVTISIKGGKPIGTTNANGEFTLTGVDAQATLVFTGANVETHEVRISGRTTLSVNITTRVVKQEEVVVTAYTTEKKKDITGSVAIVNVTEMNKQPSGLVTNLLQGQASGVTVISSGQPGADPQIRIRGINTFGNNTPLFVVDGVPTQNISDLNANDVASIQVLKDAGAASIYGSRASNGVVIITTRKGKGKVNVHYDAYYGTQLPKSGNVFNLLDPQGQADLEWKAYANSGVAPNSRYYGNGPVPVLPDYVYPVGAKEGTDTVNPARYYINPNYTSISDYNSFYRITKANKKGTDWYHELFKQAPMTSHNISVDGSSEKGSYLFSLNYLNQRGTLINTYLQRYTLRSNAQYNISKHIRIGENLATSISHNPRINDMVQNNPVFFTVQLAPIIPVYDIKGNYAGVYGTPYNGINPVAAQRRSAGNKTVGNRLFGNMYAEADFLQYFTFRTSFGGDNYSGAASFFSYPTYENASPQTINSYNQSSYTGYNWTWTNTLAFRKVFAKLHDVKVLVGTEAYKSRSENFSAVHQDYFSFLPDYVTLHTGSGSQFVDGYRGMESLSSEFGRVDYAYDGKYLLSATLRYDGSSKLVNNNYGWFPAFSAGWRVSQESFMKDIHWISDLKLRGSWGVMGNQLNVGADNGFSTFTTSNPGATYDIGNTNNTLSPGFQVGQIGNPNARWEKDINTNIGIDASLFGGKLDITADYYRKDIQDLLFNPPVPGAQGAGTPPYVNIAQMKNDGLDLYISAHQSVGKEFRLDESVSFTTYNNRIIKVTDNLQYFDVKDTRHFGTNFIRNQVGQAVGSFYGYKIIGFWNSKEEVDAANQEARQATGSATAVYQTDAGVGRFRYADVKKDGQITPDDRTFLGNPNPDFSIGLNLRATWRDLDLSAFFYGVHGNKLTNIISYWTDFFGNYAGAKSKTAMYDSWTPTHHNAKVAIQEVNAYQSSGATFNSYFVQDGSYLRLKNIQAGYTVPAAKLSKLGIQKLRVYVQAANLFTATKYTGLDPEVSGSSVQQFGVDEGIYNNQRTFLVGINLNF